MAGIIPNLAGIMVGVGQNFPMSACEPTVHCRGSGDNAWGWCGDIAGVVGTLRERCGDIAGVLRFVCPD